MKGRDALSGRTDSESVRINVSDSGNRIHHFKTVFEPGFAT
jgi:hypothetical protein